MSSINITENVYSRLQEYAKSKRIPIEAFVETSIEERLSQLEQWERMKARLPQASREAFLQVLKSVPDATPRPDDEWPAKTKTARRSTKSPASSKRTRGH